ncbi:MAG TPA: hypothetical protein VJU77_16810 [Chthoniobacterales bacterium]|nr:hypothetical protein [Chthoniobacterales bacterium]
MPNQITSKYEVARHQDANTARQVRARHRVIGAVRKGVEHALGLDRQAGELERQVAAYDADTDGFQQRVHSDHVAWNLRLIFFSAILLYVFLELISSGDIAEFLAHQMAPLFRLDTAGETPMWLRRLAGAAFIGGMLGATLLIKFVTTWFAGVFRAARASTMPGEHLRYWSLTGAIWGMYFAKVVYVGAAACLYVWLFGFAQQRAALMADIATEQKQVVESTDLGIKIQRGAVETETVAVAKPAGTVDSAATTRLAGASGVFYAVIVLLHALVLLLPTEGFARELEFAHFKRGKANARATAFHAEEERTLRDIYERIRLAPADYQQDLVYSAEPVVPKINKLYGSRVIRIAGRDQNSSLDGNEPGGDATRLAPLSPRTPNGPTGDGTAAVAESSRDNSAPIDQVPATNWDTIFPGAQHS